MALNDYKANAVTGLFMGIGALVLAPVLRPILASVARPVAKGVIRGGIMLYERGRESVAEAGEMLEDVLAEVQVEMAEEQQAAMAATAPPAGERGRPGESTEPAAGAEEHRKRKKETAAVHGEEPA